MNISCTQRVLQWTVLWPLLRVTRKPCTHALLMLPMLCQDLRDLIKRLLERYPNKRLGCSQVRPWAEAGQQSMVLYHWYRLVASNTSILKPAEEQGCHGRVVLPGHVQALLTR